MQLKIFDRTVTAECTLMADSPKRAFYKIMIVYFHGKWWIEKKSGAGDHVLNCRRWEMDSEDAAVKFYRRKIREKLKPGRHRVYRQAS